MVSRGDNIYLLVYFWLDEDHKVPSVQEVVTHLYSKLLYKMGHYFLDIQYS